MSAGDRYLLDTNVISQIRAAGLSASAFVGADDVAVTETIVDELFFDLPLDDWKIPVLGGILASLDDPIEVSEALVAQAVELEDRYSVHQPPLSRPDALIAAAALRETRILITRDRDFHCVAGLRVLDSHGFDPSSASLIASRAPVVAGPSDRPCCRALRRAAR